MARKAQRHIVGDVTIFQRKLHWHVAYTISGRRSRHSLKVTNLRVAQQRAREIDELIQRGEYSTLEDRKAQRDQTFATFVDEFRAKHQNWSANTWKGVQSVLRYVVAEWGDRPLTGINTRMIETFITRRLDQDGITKATANRHLACLKTMFKMAVRWGLLAYNPAEKVKTLKETPKVPRALSEEEIERLLRDLPGHAIPLVVVAVDTGMRRGELFSLRWDDVDFNRRTVTVRQSKNNTFRVIPMTDRVFETMQEQRQKGIIPYVLPGTNGGPIKCVKSALIAAGERTGIGHLHLHMFRHNADFRIMPTRLAA